MTNAARLGFIGLGSMGSAMAARLLDAGYAVTVFDTNPAALQPFASKGATIANGAAVAASEADIILGSLPTPDVVREVAIGPGGVIKGAKARIFIDLSTTGPRVSGEVAAGLAKAGMTLVDAPVSGGRAGAIKGTLAVMVAAPRATYQEVENILKVFGKVFYVGEKAGLAQTMKLVNNMLSIAALAITSEGMVMGVKAGLDIINASSGRNSATTDKFPRAVLPRTFDFGFATGLSVKDIGLCLQEAGAMGVPMPVGSAVHQVLSITNALFGPQSDFTSMCKTVEQWAG